MNPEIYSYVEEKLFKEGALDIYITPIIMKKGRPAVKLSILVDEKNSKNIEEIVFKETTSIGIRKYKVEKTMLERDFTKIITRYGAVTVKTSYYDGTKINAKAEYEDCKRLAKENNVSIRKIYDEVNNILRSR